MTDTILAITDARAEVGDEPVFVVNIENGRIAEIPCGPRDAAYFSGDRIVVWVAALRRPVIAARHAKRWRFYEDFCTDPEVNARVGLDVEQGHRYFRGYMQFARARGLGAQARSVKLEQERLERLWHPALIELRNAARQHGGQSRLDASVVDSITAQLPMEQRRVEQERAEQQRVEQEQARAEQAEQAEQARAEQAQQEQSRKAKAKA